MANFVYTTDFAGRYNMPSASPVFDNQQITIDKYEEQILTDLLGYTLYNELIADLDVNKQPQTVKWQKFINGTTYTNRYNIPSKHLSIKETLVPIIFWYIINEFQIYQYNKQINPAPQNSTAASEYSNGIVSVNIYNEGIMQYNESIAYLKVNSTDFLNARLTPKDFKQFITI